MLERFFRLRENGTTPRTEVMAGITTFLTMAYIIVVQPAVLSGAMFGFDTGMDFRAVTMATCLAAAVATGIMAIVAKYPIALAPGMGQNFFFVFSVLPAIGAAGYADGWQTAMGVVFVSGVIFLLLTLVGLRSMIVRAISLSMKHAIAVGIGLFIAFIGLRNASLVQPDEGTLVTLNPQFASPDLIVFFVGLLVTAVLHTRRTRGSILWGIVTATAAALLIKGLLVMMPSLTELPLVATSMLHERLAFPHAIVSLPPSLAPTAFKLDILGALTLQMLPFIIIFVFMDMFDTIGTLIGVTQEAGLLDEEGELPRANEAMLADSVGTVAGACLGTSTVTSFIESAAGVEQGGRTGLTALVTAICFLLALFFTPLVEVIGVYPPITAPALVIVGAMMIRQVREVEWDDYSEGIPAFLVIIGIPLTFSIADGLALGFISYPIIKLFSGRGREVSWLMYGLAIVLVLYFVTVRASLGAG